MSYEKVMELGSDRGIAREFGLATPADILSLTPFDRRWEGQAGTSQDSLSVMVNFSAGSPQEVAYLEEEFLQEHACEHDPSTGHSSVSIGQQLAEWEENGCVAESLELHRVKSRSYRDMENEDYWEFVALTPINWGRLRRRVEDNLRKTQDKQVLFLVAQYLNCKIY